jgi:hypothetical protein
MQAEAPRLSKVSQQWLDAFRAQILTLGLNVKANS